MVLYCNKTIVEANRGAAVLEAVGPYSYMPSLQHTSPKWISLSALKCMTKGNDVFQASSKWYSTRTDTDLLQWRLLTSYSQYSSTTFYPACSTISLVSTPFRIVLFNCSGSGFST